MAPPQTQQTNSDAVARAATERADKLEREVAALKAKLEEKLAAKASPSGAIVPGTKSYRLTEPHYRRGRYFQPGEVITVTDEQPGKSWVPVVEKAATQMVEAAPEPMRAADQQV